jgi:hypothetical protein
MGTCVWRAEEFFRCWGVLFVGKSTHLIGVTIALVAECIVAIAF